MTALKMKKSATRRFFLLCLPLLVWSLSDHQLTLAAEQSCAGETYDETVIVKHVHDGDSIKLTDGRSIRLIGINAPEVARDGRADEAFALPARDLLMTLLSDHNNRIKLIHGREKKDHYQRSLAHLFLPDGTNVQAQLLASGLVNVISIPPNIRFTHCYQQAEKRAFCDGKGLWSQPIPVIENLNDSARGFHVLRGELKNINGSRSGLWLTLEHGLTLRIHPSKQPLFDRQRLQSLVGQPVIVRGWLQAKKDPKKGERFYMEIKHPASIKAESSALQC
ncbi:MAG: thermonuclease family protein [Gammaproteobacteria bacterium]|jgi:endonuclease YncB( thermonuclease family)|nr:thermonuclease family protein [Gammaproteobacteria bacterium]